VAWEGDGSQQLGDSGCVAGLADVYMKGYLWSRNTLHVCTEMKKKTVVEMAAVKLTNLRTAH
jgi:hypothetical protein